jgi:hypothetical protein
MAVFRRKKKPRPPMPPTVTDLAATLRGCLERLEQLERERETDIKRMAAMQAEIDHLRAIMNRTS